MKSKLAINGFIFGILGILLIGSVYFTSADDIVGDASIILFLISLIISKMGMKRIKENNLEGKGFAKSGLIISIIGIIIWIIFQIQTISITPLF